VRRKFIIEKIPRNNPDQGRKPVGHRKSDERILGDSAFVKKVLAQNEEVLERKYALRSKGIGIENIAERAAHLLGMTYDEVWLPGKYQKQVAARSLLCFWAVTELGFSVTSLGKKLGISAPAVSKSVRRGAAIAHENGYTIFRS
jgi:putative transposase